MKVNFDNNRCYFGGFNSENDHNPESGKSGACYYNFPITLFGLIPFILKKIGIIEQISFAENANTVIYVNRNSLLKWLKRHREDVYETNKLNVFTNNCQWDKAIELVCNQIALIQKARDFTNQQDHSQKVFNAIKDVLNNPKFKEDPDAFLLNWTYQKRHTLQPDQALIFFIKNYMSEECKKLALLAI